MNFKLLTLSILVLTLSACGGGGGSVVQVELVSETPDDIDRMKARFRDAPEVQQCFYVTGEADFMLVVVVDSMAAYEDFTRRAFFQDGNVRKFRTYVSMDAVKTGTALNI